MSIDGRALRQQAKERAALNDLIAGMDAWIATQLKAIRVSPPPLDADQAAVEKWAEAEADRLEAEIRRATKAAVAQLQQRRRRAAEMGRGATRRLVEAQLPTAEEVRDGVTDPGREHR